MAGSLVDSKLAMGNDSGMIRRSAIPILVLVPLVAGCELLAGIQERAYKPQATDWTQQLVAVYSFELPSPELGKDSSGNGFDLQESSNPTQSSDAKEGAYSLSLSKDEQSSLALSMGGFGEDGENGFTFGAWLRPTFIGDSGSDNYLVGRTDSNTSGGYLINYDSQNSRVLCTFIGPPYASAEIDEVSPGGWFHLVCSYDAAADQVNIYGNGSFGGSEVCTAVGYTGSFRVPISNNLATALIDEVFFAYGPLSEESIRRIWACGISGARCTCNADDPAKYEDCGGAKPGCDGLPPCNQPTP